jgi:DNA-binding CsgD family transcriptional regulator
VQRTASCNYLSHDQVTGLAASNDVFYNLGESNSKRAVRNLNNTGPELVGCFVHCQFGDKVMTAITQRSTSSGTDALSENKECERVDDLILQLVSQIVSICEPLLQPQGEHAREEIVLDRNVDGVRYLLVRMPSPAPSFVHLTPREQEIVRMVAKGYPNKTIAGVLNISSWTVCTHLRRTFAKLGVASRAAMVARLLEEGRIWDQLRPEEKPLSRPTRPSMTAKVNVPTRPLPRQTFSRRMSKQTLPAIAAMLGVAVSASWAVPALAAPAQSTATTQSRSAPLLHSGDLVRLRSGGPLLTVKRHL